MSLSIFKPIKMFKTVPIFLNKGAVVIIAHDGLTWKERIKLIKFALLKKQ